MRISTWITFSLVVVLAGCSKAKPDEPGPVGPSDEAAETPSQPGAARPSLAAPDAVLVGVVHEDGTRVCAPDWKEEWINMHYEIGFVPLLVEGDVVAQLKATYGKPVVAHGRVSEQGPVLTEKPPAKLGDCPAAQMRSDWVASPEGFRIKRGGRPGIVAFAVDRIAPFDMLKLTKTDDALDFALTNTLSTALDAPVTVVMHYEGCYGKPGVESRSVVAEQGLAPGEKLTGSFPLLVQAVRVPGNPKGTSDHNAYSIQIKAEGRGAYFDFDEHVSDLGATVPCPN